MIRPKWLRWLAGLLASVVTTAVVAAFSALSHPAMTGYDLTQYLFDLIQGDRETWLFVKGVAGSSAVVAFAISLVAAAFVGWPLLMLTERRGWISLRAYVGIGVLVSITVATLLYITVDAYLPDLYVAMLAALCSGPAAAAVLWFIVRPDRTSGATGE